MAKISKKTLEEVADITDRGCDYADTQEVIHEYFYEALKENGGFGDWDDMSTMDLADKEIVLQDLFESFYDNVRQGFLNILETCE